MERVSFVLLRRVEALCIDLIAGDILVVFCSFSVIMKGLFLLEKEDKAVESQIDCFLFLFLFFHFLFFCLLDSLLFVNHGVWLSPS